MLISFSLLFVQCEKQDSLQKNNNIYPADKFLTDFDIDYFPEGDVEDNMQDFFDAVNNYIDNPEFVSDDFLLSEGIWYLTSALNYECADAMAQIDEFEIITESYDFDLSDDEDYDMDGNDLLEGFLTLYEAIDELNTETRSVALVGLNYFQLNDDDLTISFNVLRGQNTTYDAVSLQTGPTGVPTNATLKMGLSYGNYQSAAKENTNRYNPYLYRSKYLSQSMLDKKYIVSNVQFHPVLWTDYSNCHYNWPDGDWILFVGSSQQNYLSAQVNGTRFNTYLSRFFTAKVEDMIDDNQNYSAKTLFLSAQASFVPECLICGYPNPYAKSVLQFTRHDATVSSISTPLSTL